MSDGDDIAETVAYWRSNRVRASEVLCSMGRFGNEWKEVGLAMRAWRANNREAERDYHMTWDETERELTGGK